MRRLLGDIGQLIGDSRRDRPSVTGESRRDPVPERESEELRVMTFNVRGSYHRDGDNTWERRTDLNVDVIKRWRPDLIGFQEFQRGNLKTYEKRLPEYEKHLGPRYQNRQPHAFNAIFWDASRMELVEESGFWLSQTPKKFSGSWETRQIRSANVLRFRLIPEGREFLYLNTHLDHKSVQARRNGSKLIVRELEDSRETPTIVTGDFNAEPGKPVHDNFTKSGFEDVHDRCGNPKTRTFHRFEGDQFKARHPEKEYRMDWVLVRDGASDSWETKACHVIRDCDPPVFPSDHYPVTARLHLT